MELKKSPKFDINRYSQVFLATGLCISLLISITAFEWKFYDKGGEVDLGMVEENFNELLEIPITEQPPPPPPKMVQPEIIEVPDEEIIEEDIEVDLDVEITEDEVIEDIIYVEEEVDEEVDEIFTIVEQEATPVGGYEAFYTFVSRNLKYPAIARKAGIEGKVILVLTIGKTGSIDEVSLAKGIGFECDEEAMRIVKNYPSGWNPGKQRGRAVKTRMYLPLNFKLSK